MRCNDTQYDMPQDAARSPQRWVALRIYYAQSSSRFLPTLIIHRSILLCEVHKRFVQSAASPRPTCITYKMQGVTKVSKQLARCFIGKLRLHRAPSDLKRPSSQYSNDLKAQLNDTHQRLVVCQGSSPKSMPPTPPRTNHHKKWYEALLLWTLSSHSSCPCDA